MVKKIQIKFTNKWFYTFVIIIAIFALAIGVYAIAPNPGHNANQVGPGTFAIGDYVFPLGSKIGIGRTPVGELDVNGTASATKFIGDGSGLTDLVVRVTGAGTCDATTSGLLRYRGGICVREDYMATIFDICARTASSTYAWENVFYDEWSDVSCDTNGCPSGQEFYQCTGFLVQPGCYAEEPAGCWCVDGPWGEIVCPY